jgi:hypothetical protein
MDQLIAASKPFALAFPALIFRVPKENSAGNSSGARSRDVIRLVICVTYPVNWPETGPQLTSIPASPPFSFSSFSGEFGSKTPKGTLKAR